MGQHSHSCPEETGNLRRMIANGGQYNIGLAHKAKLPRSLSASSARAAIDNQVAPACAAALAAR
jgi:hypothetical protein